MVERGKSSDTSLEKMASNQSLKKVKKIQETPIHITLEDIQGLNGKLTILDRFIIKCIEKSLPIFKTLNFFSRKVTFGGSWKSKRPFAH